MMRSVFLFYSESVELELRRIEISLQLQSTGAYDHVVPVSKARTEAPLDGRESDESVPLDALIHGLGVGNPEVYGLQSSQPHDVAGVEDAHISDSESETEFEETDLYCANSDEHLAESGNNNRIVDVISAISLQTNVVSIGTSLEDNSIVNTGAATRLTAMCELHNGLSHIVAVTSTNIITHRDSPVVAIFPVNIGSLPVISTTFVTNVPAVVHDRSLSMRIPNISIGHRVNHSQLMSVGGPKVVMHTRQSSHIYRRMLSMTPASALFSGTSTSTTRSAPRLPPRLPPRLVRVLSQENSTPPSSLVDVNIHPSVSGALSLNSVSSISKQCALSDIDEGTVHRSKVDIEGGGEVSITGVINDDSDDRRPPVQLWMGSFNMGAKVCVVVGFNA